MQADLIEYAVLQLENVFGFLFDFLFLGHLRKTH
jgi:hypothetical protein